MELLINDAIRAPHAFCWFGAIPPAELDAWIQRSQALLANDLLDFWRMTGGGDLFESETILRPTVESLPNACFVSGDDTDSVNSTQRERGMPKHLFVFQIGVFFSAVDMRYHKYVTLSESYVPQAQFNSLEQWYRGTLRAEFGSTYGLK
ncbi:MAG: hypothetical protein ACJ71Q_05035 [Terriglobales bacterium]